jgi:hypothetical protein
MPRHPFPTDWRTWLNLATVVFSVWFLLFLAQEQGVRAIRLVFEAAPGVGITPSVGTDTVNRVLGTGLRIGLVAAVGLFFVAFYYLTKATNERGERGENV